MLARSPASSTAARLSSMLKLLPITLPSGAPSGGVWSSRYLELPEGRAERPDCL